MCNLREWNQLLKVAWVWWDVIVASEWLSCMSCGNRMPVTMLGGRMFGCDLVTLMMNFCAKVTVLSLSLARHWRYAMVGSGPEEAMSSIKISGQLALATAARSALVCRECMP